MKTNQKCVVCVIVLLAIITVVVQKTYRDTRNSFSNQVFPNPSSTSTIPVINQAQSIKPGWTKIKVPKLENFSYAEFSLEFPNTWKIEGNSEIFKLKKDDRLNITMNRAGVGGGVCVFPDTNTKELEQTPWQGAPVYTNYSSISTQYGKLRLVLLNNTMPNNNYEDGNNHYQLCELYTGESIYEVPLDGGIISITTPANETKSELSEIKSILETYQYTNRF